jgi:hypothetical protein
MGSAKLKRREARAIAKRLIAEGRADPPTVGAGEMKGRWTLGDGVSAQLRAYRRPESRELELVAVVHPPVYAEDGEGFPSRLTRLRRDGFRWIVPVRRKARLRPGP